MGIADSLFSSKDICLGPIDMDRDSVVESSWSHDLEFMRTWSLKPAVPQSAAQIKRNYEKIEKNQEESNNFFHFSIRLRTDDSLIGTAEIFQINWSNAAGAIKLMIGEAESRSKGLGTQAAHLLLRFAFDELNMYRLGVTIAEFNVVGRKFAEKFGFSIEACRRQALERDGLRWNLYHYGMLRSEYIDRLPAYGSN